MWSRVIGLPGKPPHTLAVSMIFASRSATASGSAVKLYFSLRLDAPGPDRRETFDRLGLVVHDRVGGEALVEGGSIVGIPGFEIDVDRCR